MIGLLLQYWPLLLLGSALALVPLLVRNDRDHRRRRAERDMAWAALVAPAGPLLQRSPVDDDSDLPAD